MTKIQKILHPQNLCRENFCHIAIFFDLVLPTNAQYKSTVIQQNHHYLSEKRLWCELKEKRVKRNKRGNIPKIEYRKSTGDKREPITTNKL